MICVRCQTANTTCVDDMLQVGYVAEIHVCNDCNGTIEVEYKGHNICREDIKTYRYISD